MNKADFYPGQLLTLAGEQEESQRKFFLVLEVSIRLIKIRSLQETHAVESYNIDLAAQMFEKEGGDWTRDDQEAALAEGWGVFDIDNRNIQLEIQTYDDDEQGRFVSDLQARAYVFQSAFDQGHPSHRLCFKAARLIVENERILQAGSPKENS